MAREFGHYSPKQLENFLISLKRTAGWEQKLELLETRVEKLKSEGQFDNDYWINKMSELPREKKKSRSDAR